MTDANLCDKQNACTMTRNLSLIVFSFPLCYNTAQHSFLFTKGGTMPDNLCCVCGQSANKALGQRWFCEQHYHTATRERQGAWRSLWGQVIALVVFVLIVYFGQALIKPEFSTLSLTLTGVILALIVSAIWLGFFYQQDRLEPEPKGYVLGVFVLGALLAAALGTPFLDNVFHVSKWLYTNTVTTILGSILVVGFTQEFLKYAAVRYSVYSSAEFDEATDGIVYATAAGLGYATVLNVQFVVANGGVDLGAGIIRMAIFALAHASFAGVTGYFLGRAKFESEPLWWMPTGITLAAVLNGLFFWLRGEITQSSSLTGSTNPWLGLALAAVVAIATTGALTWLIRRNIQAAIKA
jgi:RsiW-degrading membrane proteinase PrsW (M82 family)